MCGLKYPKPFVFQRCAARWLTIRPPRKRYAKDIVTENWSKIYDDGSTRSRPSLIAVTRRGRPLANSNGWTKERERGKGRMENERKGENGRIQVSVARRGWNSWLDRSRLRDGDKLFISRRLATGQHFPYLSTILRLFIRARAHVVVGALCRASLSILSFHYTVATVHPEFMALLEREDSRAFTVWIKRETNGRKINRASRD